MSALFELRGLLADGQALVRSGRRLVGAAVLRAAGAQSLAGSLAVAPAASASGTPTPALAVTAAADAAITASTQAPGVYLDLSATRQWATGALAQQCEVVVRAPTYAFVGASTVALAATLYVSDAPHAGTNATLTNAYAFWVDAGAVRFDGMVIQNAVGRLNSTTDTGVSPTVNTPAGIVRVQSGSTSVTVTCAACTTGSIITGNLRNVTTNSVNLRSIVPGNGSFVVNLSADPGASHADVVVRIDLAGTGV